MKKCFALAALAAIGFSGAAFAENASGGRPTTEPTAMSDSELGKVTAGAYLEVTPNCSTNGQCLVHVLGGRPGHNVGGPDDNGRFNKVNGAAKFETGTVP